MYHLTKTAPKGGSHMLIKVAMTREEDKKRITLCKPPEKQTELTLSNISLYTNWLNNLPFDTNTFTFYLSDEPLGAEVAIHLSPIPYVGPAKAYTRFEIQNDKGKFIGTSMTYPLATLLLRTSELDPAIIAEKRAIYLGVGPSGETRSNHCRMRTRRAARHHNRPP